MACKIEGVVIYWTISFWISYDTCATDYEDDSEKERAKFVVVFHSVLSVNGKDQRLPVRLITWLGIYKFLFIKK
jgi:hypothetical protein